MILKRFPNPCFWKSVWNRILVSLFGIAKFKSLFPTILIQMITHNYSFLSKFEIKKKTSVTKRRNRSFWKIIFKVSNNMSLCYVCTSFQIFKIMQFLKLSGRGIIASIFRNVQKVHICSTYVQNQTRSMQFQSFQKSLQVVRFFSY